MSSVVHMHAEGMHMHTGNDTERHEASAHTDRDEGPCQMVYIYIDTLPCPAMLLVKSSTMNKNRTNLFMDKEMPDIFEEVQFQHALWGLLTQVPG